MARHSQINAADKLGYEIDLANASKDELIEYLCNTIQYEVEKGDDADCDLIRECSDWLDELTADEFVFTPEELAARLEAIKNGKDINSSRYHKTHQPKFQSKRRIFVRVGILVAAIMILSVLTLSVIADHAGYHSAWEYISTNVNKLFGLNAGEVIYDNSITVIKNTGTTKYSNMEEFLQNESIDILYPYTMPDDVEITQIRFVERADNKYMLYFSFSKGSNVFNVANYYTSYADSLSNYECITIDNMQFYIKKINDTLFYAVLQYNGFEYIIQSTTYDDLLIIIKNMKGITP